MIRYTILFASLAAVGCQNAPAEPNPPSPESTPAPTTVVAKPVNMKASDVAPALLYAREALKVSNEFVQTVQATPPAQPISFDDGAPVETTTTDSLFIHAKNSAVLEETLEVDNTQGESYLFLSPQVTGTDAINEVLRGIRVFDSAGVQVNVRAAKVFAEGTKDPNLPMSSIPLGQAPIGTYKVRFDNKIARAGVAIDLRQPQSPISMKMKPSTLEHLLGNDGSVDVTLNDASAGITGATVTATLLDPDLKPLRPITFTEVGQGKYRANIGGSFFSKSDPVGAYLVDIHAVGTTSAGTKFRRSGRTGFHFGIPTAKIAGVGATRVIRDDKGLISAFEADVEIDAASLDRLELSATLAARGTDGYEHPVAVAFTGWAYDAGHHTMTLHFDAGYAKLTHLDGALTLRNLKLFSLGTNTLFQRIGEVAVAPFAPFTLKEVAPLKLVTPAVANLIDQGVLFKD